METKKVLIIEDDIEIRDSLKYVLEMEGFEVKTARNGLDGLDHLLTTTELPNAILLDIMMPVMDGYQFREHQLKFENLATIPTVVISADRNFQQKAQHLKFHELIKKPIDLDHLIQVLNTI